MIKAIRPLRRASATHNPRRTIDQLIDEYDAAFVQWFDAVRARGVNQEPTPVMRKLCVARERPADLLQLVPDI